MKLVLLLTLASSCDWSLHRMQEQPRCELDEPTALFADGACDQPPPAGVVPFGRAEDDAPPPVTRALLLRGRDRFERFCAPCHGALGDGDSAVARDMKLRRPPSLLDDAVVRLPDEKIVDVIGHGYGLMPPYADALAPADRWAVLHFVRVLERRDVAWDALPAPARQEASAWLR